MLMLSYHTTWHQNPDDCVLNSVLVSVRTSDLIQLKLLFCALCPGICMGVISVWTAWHWKDRSMPISSDGGTSVKGKNNICISWTVPFFSLGR